MKAADAAMRSVNASKGLVEFFTGLAARAYDDGRIDLAIIWVSIAAEFAWGLLPGFHSSPEMERLLLECAKHVPDAASSDVRDHASRADGRPRILHIATKAYDIGGHARVIERWALRDRKGIHSLVTLAQGRQVLPDWLRQAIASSGGQIHVVEESDYLRKAARLRELWRRSTHVLDNTHPHDPTPILAFGVEGGPPVIRYNTADMVFWLGVSVADVVLNSRDSGHQCALQRRGCVRNEFLPLPLIDFPIEERDAALRARLGIPAQACVLLTVGTAYKFTPSGKWNFFRIMEQVLGSEADACLIAVGPRLEGMWQALSSRFPGRVFPMGAMSDFTSAIRSADISVESFPFCSPTSSMEAILRCAVPVHRVRERDAPVMSNDDPALAAFPSYEDVGEYVAGLRELIRCRDARVDLGKRQREAVRAVHCSTQWDERADRVLAAATGHSVRTFTPGAPVQADALRIAEFQHGVGYLKCFSIGVQGIKQYRDRIRLAHRLRSALRLLRAYPYYVSDVMTLARTVREFVRSEAVPL